MSKEVKILLWALGIPFIVIAVAAVLAVLFFPSHKIKTFIEKEASSALDMPLTVGHVGLSIMGIPSLKVSDITLGESRDGEPPLFTMKSAKVRVNLLKLIRKEVEIVLIEFDRPSVTLVNRHDGTSNLPESNEATTSGSEPGTIQPPQIPFPITLKKFRVIDASLIMDSSAVDGSIVQVGDIDMQMYLDISRDLKKLVSTGEIDFSDISMTVPGRDEAVEGVVGDFEFDLSGDLTTGSVSMGRGELTVNGIPISITAHTKEWSKTSINVALNNLDIVDALQAVPPGLIPDQEKLTAEGTITLGVDGTVDSGGVEPDIAYTGAVDIDITGLAFEGLPKQVDRIVSHITFTEKDMETVDTIVTIGGSGLSLQGTVSDYPGTPTVSIAAKGDIDLADIAGAVPLSDGMTMSGGVKFDIELDGDPADPATFAAKGGVDIVNVSATLPETLRNPAAVNGTIRLSPSAVRIERIAVKSGSSDLLFAGKISNYMTLAGLGEENALFKGTLRSTTADLNDLLVSEETEEPSESKPWDMEETLATLPIPPTLSGDLAIEMGTVKVSMLKADSVKGRLTFGDGVFRLLDMNVKAYMGTMTGSTTLNAANPDDVNYGGDFKLDAFDSASFIADFFGAGEILRGKMSSSFNFSGAGLDSLSMLENLKASGDMNFSNGQIVNLDFTKKLGDHLKFLNFDTVDFDSIKNSFKVENQKFVTPDMVLKTKHGDIEVNGFTGFDKALDYDIKLNLDKAASEKALKSLSRLTKYVEAKPERLELNVKATGSLLSPSFKLDTSDAESILSDSLKQQLKKEVDNLLDSKDLDELKKKGKNLLKGLLKK